jgi:sigma-E factor negative regulatory protein RseA
MIKSGQEWVSAAVDGEVDAQTLAELSADNNSHDKWQRYHLIGDAMRGELPAALSLDLSASIMAAIELEPAHKQITTSAAANDLTIQAQDAQKTVQTVNAPKSNNVVPLFKQLGQYAIAASVALVAVVGVQNYNQEQDAQAPMSVLSTRPLVGTVSPVSLQTGAVPNSQGVTSEQLIEQRRRVNAYIQDHMLQQRLNPGVVIDENSRVESNR